MSAHIALCKAAAVALLICACAGACVCVYNVCVYAHQLCHRQLRLGRFRRLRLLLDALLCRRHLRLGGLQVQHTSRAAVAANGLETICSE